MFVKKILFTAANVMVMALAAVNIAHAQSWAERAEMTMGAIYSHYSDKGTFLLREHYPFDAEAIATYTADGNSKVNPYSFLWPFSGTLSATSAAMEYDQAQKKALKERVLPALEEYYDDRRSPAAYSSYITSAKEDDRYYDDNIWLGIDFTDLYLLTGEKKYLRQAKMIWKFIMSGTDEVLGGGIYWCEQKKHSKNTCSNAPGAVYAAKLYMATGNRKYLDKAVELYDWTRTNLLDREDDLYLDNISLSGKIDRRKFSYNSGQMIQAGVLLYRLTSEEKYLQQARRTAEGCHRRFFRAHEDGFRMMKGGNVWFDAVMMRGIVELYLTDHDDTILKDIEATLEYAWEKARTKEGLFTNRYSVAESDKPLWLLDQAAMAEMFARMASVRK